MDIRIDDAWKAACPGVALGCLFSRVKVETDCPDLQKEMEQSLEKIAVEMNYSYPWVRHLHGRALQAVALPQEDTP